MAGIEPGLTECKARHTSLLCYGSGPSGFHSYSSNNGGGPSVSSRTWASALGGTMGPTGVTIFITWTSHHQKGLAWPLKTHIPVQERDWGAIEARTHHLPLVFSLVDTQYLKERCETFIEPQILPPIHGHDVSEPLEREGRREVSAGRQLGHLAWCLWSQPGRATWPAPAQRPQLSFSSRAGH